LGPEVGLVHRMLLTQGVRLAHLDSGSAAAWSIADWGPAGYPVARVLAGYALDLGRLLDAKTALAMNALRSKPARGSSAAQELTHELPLLDHRGHQGGVTLHYAFARVPLRAEGGPTATTGTRLQLLDRYAVLGDVALGRCRGADSGELSEAGLVLREARLWTPTDSAIGGVETRLAEVAGPLAALRTSLIAVALGQTKRDGGLVTLWYGAQLAATGAERARDRVGDLPLVANDVAPAAVTLRGGSILRYSTDTSGEPQGELTYFDGN